jgi:RHS repeat-associated protein
VQEPLNFGAASQYGLMRTEPMKFTSHERDFNGAINVENTDYLDYMHARYYSPVMGRFLSVDPALNVKRAVLVPGAWNHYSYSLNNPTKYVDPDGKDAVIFMVAPYHDNFKQVVGHAAIFVRNGNQSAGVSAFGKNWFQNGEKSFIKDYAGHGQPVTAYVLKTTPQQDAAMLSFIKSTSDGVRYGGGTTLDSSVFGLGPRNNCTTAVDNVLRAGHVGTDEQPGRSMGGLGIDVPKQLQDTLETGSLSGLVLARRTFDDSNLQQLDGLDDHMNFMQDLPREPRP